MIKPLRPMRYLAIAVIALCTVTPVDASYAAGRIFFDGFESGNTDLWMQDNYRDRCQVVTSAADGIKGPRSGKYMVRCNSNGPAAWNTATKFETLVVNTSNYANELFIRAWVRIDQNHDRTDGSAKKLLRIYVSSGGTVPLDVFEIVRTSNGLNNQVALAGKNLTTYWGGAGGDNSATVGEWHRIEYYIKQSPGTVKIWHDGVLVRNDTGLNFQGVRWSPLFITSNWGDAHDTVNYVYFDDLEVFSDTGSGAAGLMSDATISAGPSVIVPPPPNVRFNP